MRNALFLAAAALLAAPAAMAEGLSYTYLDARYFSTDTDALNVNQQGGVLAGSFALDSIFYVTADGRYGKSEKVGSGATSGRFDTITSSVTAGAHYAVTPALDLFGEAGGLYSKLEGKGTFNGQDDDGFGYLVKTGLRLALIPRVELDVFGGYNEVLGDTDSYFAADLQYHFDEHFTLVGGTTNANRVDSYSIGARYRF